MGFNSAFKGLKAVSGAFAKLRKPTITFVLSVRQSVRTEQLDGFSWNLVLQYFFENLWRKFKFDWNLTRITGNLRDDICTFMTLSPAFLLGMRKFRTKVVEKIKTQFMFSNSPHPRKSCRLWDNVEKCGGAGQATDDYVAHALCLLDTCLQTHTQNM